MTTVDPLNTSFSLAILEISIMLIGAFILGYRLSYEINNKRFKQLRSDSVKTPYKPRTQQTLTADTVNYLPMNTTAYSNDIMEGKTPRNLEHSLAARKNPVDRLLDIEALSYTDESSSLSFNNKITESFAKHSQALRQSNEKTKQINNNLSRIATQRNRTSINTPITAKDDLTLIHGITKEIEQLLNNHCIDSFEKLYNTHIPELNNIMKETHLIAHYVESWPKQAYFAYQKEWKLLKQLQYDRVQKS